MTDTPKPRRYLVWLCDGCFGCEPQYGPIPTMPCSGPSMSGAEVVHAAAYDELQRERDAALERAERAEQNFDEALADRDEARTERDAAVELLRRWRAINDPMVDVLPEQTDAFLAAQEKP